MAKIRDDIPTSIEDEHRLPCWARTGPTPPPAFRSKAAETRPIQAADAGARYLTPAETADLLRVSLRTVRRMLAEGRLDAVRIGRLVRIRRSSVDGL